MVCKKQGYAQQQKLKPWFFERFHGSTAHILIHKLEVAYEEIERFLWKELTGTLPSAQIEKPHYLIAWVTTQRLYHQGVCRKPPGAPDTAKAQRFSRNLCGSE